jgi:hypothetical protein
MFAKIYASMYDGTLATKGPWEALVTFQQFLVLCDKTGMVDMTPEAISRRTTIPLDIIARGITALEAPDHDSRRPDEDGRRIIRLSAHRNWGWQIVNYEHYRKLRSADDRRDYLREYMRERRAKEKTPAKPKPVLNGSFDAFWSAYPRHEKRKDAERAWLKINPDEALTQKIIAAIERQKLDGCLAARATADGRSTVPHPTSWLNGKRWEDEQTPAAASANPLYAGPGRAVM